MQRHATAVRPRPVVHVSHERPQAAARLQPVSRQERERLLTKLWEVIDE
jgi:hypothetical protein